MPLTREEKLRLEQKAHELRKLCLETVVWAGSGHIGGAGRSSVWGSKAPQPHSR